MRSTTFWTALLFSVLGFGLALAGGCGGAAAGDPFVGSWSCTGSAMTTFTAPAGIQPASNTTSQNVVITDDGSGALTLTRTPTDGQPDCTVHATLSADRMSFSWNPGQTCSDKNGDTLTFTAVSGVIAAIGYDTTSAWTLSGKTATGAPLMGSGTGSGSCTRM